MKEDALDTARARFGRGWGKRDWIEHDTDYDSAARRAAFQGHVGEAEVAVAPLPTARCVFALTVLLPIVPVSVGERVLLHVVPFDRPACRPVLRCAQSHNCGHIAGIAGASACGR